MRTNIKKTSKTSIISPLCRRFIAVYEATKDLKETAGFDKKAFWIHSAGVGSIARFVLDKLKLDRTESFTAGIIQDVGKLIMDALYTEFYVDDIGKQVLGHFFNEMFQMVLGELKPGTTMFQVEQDVLGLTHQEVGEGLAAKWQLPEHLVEVIGHHHDPGAALPDMAHLVHLADACSKQDGFAFGATVISENTLEKLGMEQEALIEIFKGLESELRSQVNDMFGAIFS